MYSSLRRAVVGLVAGGALALGGTLAMPPAGAEAHSSHNCGSFTSHFWCLVRSNPPEHAMKVMMAYKGEDHRGYVRLDRQKGYYKVNVCDQMRDGWRVLARVRSTGGNVHQYRDPDGAGGRCGQYRILYTVGKFKGQWDGHTTTYVKWPSKWR